MLWEKKINKNILKKVDDILLFIINRFYDVVRSFLFLIVIFFLYLVFVFFVLNKGSFIFGCIFFGWLIGRCLVNGKVVFVMWGVNCVLYSCMKFLDF